MLLLTEIPGYEHKPRVYEHADARGRDRASGGRRVDSMAMPIGQGCHVLQVGLADGQLASL
jgi:hypothetical protein